MGRWASVQVHHVMTDFGLVSINILEHLDQTRGLPALTSSCFRAMLLDSSFSTSSLLGFLHLSSAKLQDCIHHVFRRRQEIFFSEQLNTTLSWHHIPVRERAESKGACTDFALFIFAAVLLLQCFFASVWKPEDSPYLSTWSSCVTVCCWANWSVKSVKPNWTVGELRLSDFAQSSSAQTILGFISKLKIAARFPSLPFKSSLVSSWEPFG